MLVDHVLSGLAGARPPRPSRTASTPATSGARCAPTSTSRATSGERFQDLASLTRSSVAESSPPARRSRARSAAAQPVPVRRRRCRRGRGGGQRRPVLAPSDGSTPGRRGRAPVGERQRRETIIAWSSSTAATVPQRIRQSCSTCSGVLDRGPGSAPTDRRRTRESCGAPTPVRRVAQRQQARTWPANAARSRLQRSRVDLVE